MVAVMVMVLMLVLTAAAGFQSSSDPPCIRYLRNMVPDAEIVQCRLVERRRQRWWWWWWWWWRR
jgi:predicted dehydrogenase